MGHNHSYTGFESFDEQLRLLDTLGVSYTTETLVEGVIPSSYEYDLRHFRRARFKSLTGKPLVMEEYVASRDKDCDGTSTIGVKVYEASQLQLSQQR